MSFPKNLGFYCKNTSSLLHSFSILSVDMQLFYIRSIISFLFKLLEENLSELLLNDCGWFSICMFDSITETDNLHSLKDTAK